MESPLEPAPHARSATPGTILLVEDDALNRKLVTMILAREGYRVIVADTAEQGLDLARIEAPHLVIMDLKLPGMDGIEATRRLKADPELSHVPVLVLTAYAMQEDRQEAQAAGCNAFVTKPIDMKEFVGVVRELMGDHDQSPG